MESEPQLPLDGTEYHAVTAIAGVQWLWRLLPQASNFTEADRATPTV
jgi:hypothetical protein